LLIGQTKGTPETYVVRLITQPYCRQLGAQGGPATYALYEMTARLYLIPGLGSRRLTSLTVPMVQQFLNQRLEKGDSVRKVQVMRTVLSAALSRAVREELIVRNVARLAELPEWQRGTIRPWTAAEARGFLSVARPDPLYPAFVPGYGSQRSGLGKRQAPPALRPRIAVGHCRYSCQCDSSTWQCCACSAGWPCLPGRTGPRTRRS
jgi:hypothetical protein